MKVLSLDLSLHTGFAIFENEKLITYGVCEAERVGKEDSPAYPINFIQAAERVGEFVFNLISNYHIDAVVIEESVQMSKDRYAQKQLEFIHFTVNSIAISSLVKRVYLSPSQWRKILEIKMTKEDKIQNALVKKKKARGKITKKHLSVRYVNETYGFQLLMKDNDKADAIGLGRAFLKSKGFFHEAN